MGIWEVNMRLLLKTTIRDNFFLCNIYNSSMPRKQVFKKTVGSRAEVFHGTAKKTTGGLLKKDLAKNKHGEIVSRKKQMTAKKEKRLEKHGYFAKKGKFGYVKKDVVGKSKKNKTSKKTAKKSKRKGKR